MSSLTKRSRVAFLGKRGSFSEEAALKLGEEAELVSRSTSEALFSSLDEELADFILAPIENSLAGSVHRSFDLLLESGLEIIAEIIMQATTQDPEVAAALDELRENADEVRILGRYPKAKFLINQA